MNTGIENDVVRQQSFDCDGPVELDIEAGAGLVEIALADPDADRLVHVEVRVARSDNPIGSGLTGLLNLVGRFGGTEDLPGQAVRETSIGMDGNRLEVRTPKAMPLSAVPLHVMVAAPEGSAVALRIGSAEAKITGTAAQCSVLAGSGDVDVERADGAVQVQTGSGSAHLGTIGGDLSARAGSGDLEIAVVSGAAKVTTGSGNVWIGSVRGPGLVGKTGSGDFTVADAESGDLQLTSGSGNVRVGVHAGVLAELDLTTGSGRASSELEINDGPVPGDPDAVVRLRCRTGSGDATVTRATA